MAAYERAFALWPQPCEEFDVETATATTRVHAYRPHPAGDPVVLLTGAGFNASSWYPHVAALAEGGPVYGIDMPGDPNPSVARALMTPPENCAAWLGELLGKLSDRSVHLAGFSYGGWVAMNQRSARLGGSPPSRCSIPPGSPGSTPASGSGSPSPAWPA
jgi:alpha-beta hydrolase superfamily lysophospholipase